ncbi:hypothetical protein [Kitasatospora sp. NPDC056789]|uniref:hypothetical protein n=1 Tax=Kitasatospora sp. NPDC056789 TaxID=3345945 RepID=UPI00130108DD
MDLISARRLLPEAARWPAQPYLDRVATVDPQRALAWLTANKDAFEQAEEQVLLGLLQVARRIGGPSTGLVRALLATDDALRDVRWRSTLAVWLADIPTGQRDLPWVKVAECVLLHVVEHSAEQRWELQQQLADLQEAAYDQDGPRDAAIVRAVRRASVAVADAALASEPELGDLDEADDLRQTVTAHDFGPSVSRIAVRALLDLRDRRQGPPHPAHRRRELGHLGIGRRRRRHRARDLRRHHPPPPSAASSATSPAPASAPPPSTPTPSSPSPPPTTRSCSPPATPTAPGPPPKPSTSPPSPATTPGP